MTGKVMRPTRTEKPGIPETSVTISMKHNDDSINGDENNDENDDKNSISVQGEESKRNKRLRRERRRKSRKLANT
jgi:hypothetical protein